MNRDTSVAAVPLRTLLNKVPEVTLGFWIIKILATTLGETGGDTVTMTWLKADVMVNAGYLVGSAIFLSVLIVLVIAQIVAHKFHPFLYWATIVASTTFGTTMADFATPSCTRSSGDSPPRSISSSTWWARRCGSRSRAAE